MVAAAIMGTTSSAVVSGFGGDEKMGFLLRQRRQRLDVRANWKAWVLLEGTNDEQRDLGERIRSSPRGVEGAG